MDSDKTESFKNTKPIGKSKSSQKQRACSYRSTDACSYSTKRRRIRETVSASFDSCRKHDSSCELDFTEINTNSDECDKTLKEDLESLRRFRPNFRQEENNGSGSSQRKERHYLNAETSKKDSVPSTSAFEECNDAIQETGLEIQPQETGLEDFDDIYEDSHNPKSCFLDTEDESEEDSCVEEVSEDKKHPDGISSSELAEWAFDFSVTNSAVNGLLKILRRSETHLPKDARTILGTMTGNENYHIKAIGKGSYVYLGLTSSLNDVLSSVDLSRFRDTETLFLQVNVDGLRLFNSSATDMWPILGRITKPFVSVPFVIGLYCGKTKPESVHDFLEDFVREVTHLQTGPIDVVGFPAPVSISVQCFVCDTPARAFIKQTKGHSGYYGCDKCTQRGAWCDKVIFPDVDAPLRTDLDFRNHTNPEHHNHPSPLEILDVDMVTQFPLDYMHLVCLGVMKRLIFLWIKSPVSKGVRVSANSVLTVSRILIYFQQHLPVEFSRKCRSLDEVERWKATEFRQFLLYSGPVVLKDILRKDQYDHFLLLFVGILCLVDPKLNTERYIAYAEQLLQLFVSRMGVLYGRDTFVYNVHGLVHLADDVRRFGPLDSYSAFPFESFLGQLKRLVRGGKSPLQQVIRRLSERKSAKYVPNRKQDESLGPKMEHFLSPCPPQFAAYSQFKQVKVNKDCLISVSRGNNCVLIDRKYALVRNIVSKKGGETYILFERFQQVGDFFREPLCSMQVGIVLVDRLSDTLEIAPLKELTCKLVQLPYKNKHVLMPLLHQ